MTIDKVNPLLSFKNDLDETELEIIRSSNNLVKVVDSSKPLVSNSSFSIS